MSAATPLRSLRQFARRKPAERCQLCGTELAAQHPHVLEIAARKIACSCEPCAILFDNDHAGQFRRIPRDTFLLTDFAITDAQWDAFAIPINVAFFVITSPERSVRALYPSPAGPMESLLPLDAWPELARTNPVLAEFRPDVEALLINRRADAREYFRAPIDECYRLVGILRANWRGISGGADVWPALDAFFADLREKGRIQ